jgi:hypothetical protein
MSKKLKNEYDNILNLDPEDIFNAPEMQRVSLGRVFSMEKEANYELIQSRFDESEALYNGSFDFHGKY